MTVSVEELQQRLVGKSLPGGSIVIESHEAAIGDDALRATDIADGVAHPFWFIVTSLRCMGISVDELCALAKQGDSDLLLFGQCDVEQDQPMLVNLRRQMMFSVIHQLFLTNPAGNVSDQRRCFLKAISDMHGQSGILIAFQKGRQ